MEEIENDDSKKTEITDQEIEKSVTAEELSQYLDDRFRQYDLPGGQKRKQTAAEMIREAENRRRFL